MRKLTTSLLRKIIREEAAKFGAMETTEDRAKDTEEIDADEFGTDKVKEKQIDFIKALKIEEARLRRRIAKITETRRRISRNI